MLTYNLDIETGSLWLRTTPSELALKQPFYCTEAGIFYARSQFNTIRDFKDSYLLFYTLDGCGIIRQNDTVIRLLPGQALLINCRTPQSYYTDPETGIWTHYWVHFDGSGMPAFEDLLIPERRNIPVRFHTTAMQEHLDLILKNLENTSAETILQDSLLVHQILTDMILNTGEPVSQNQEMILKSAAYIQRHYTEPIKLETLMDIAHMSKAWYMRMFRKYIGTTPYNHILSLRITKAKEYLEITDMTVHEIAIATGFTDDPSFSTRFSAMTGMSPLKYRKEAITRKQSVQ